MRGGKTPLNSNSYDDLQHLVVDTSLFSATFQSALISALSSSLGDFDNHINGTLIHSDNFQALNLLQARYREQVKCIYIDPPYNTNSSEIVYKNTYKHSSWLSLMQNRIALSKNLQTPASFIFVAIDDLELFKLNELMEGIYSRENFIGNISIIHKPEGRNQEKFFGTSNEFMLVYSNDKANADFYKVILDPEKKEEFDLIDNLGAYKRKNFIRLSDGKYALREAKPEFYYPIFVSSDLSKISIEEFDDSFVVYPITDLGIERTWKTKPQTFLEYFEAGNIEAIQEDGKIVIYEKLRENQVIKTHWSRKEYHAYHFGTKPLENILGTKEFSFPKSIHTVLDTLKLTTKDSEIILDYFAGSGTTAHAVINLNREDNGNRQYILVEQGEYFDTVLKPRVQKVIYSKAWKDGKPVAEDKAESLQGVPQIVKVLKLESYEDTLNNLELHRSGLFDHLPENAQQDYLLNYMLNLESRGSLLNVSHFEKPFDYGLNISTTSAGAYEWQKVDLVETFNYLIGAKVINVDDKRAEQGFVAVECRLPNQSADEKTLIFWRDCERVDYDGLQAQFGRLGINPADSEYSQVYVNGDHTLETVWDGEQSGSLKIVSIEDVFLSLMFEGDA